MPTTGVYDENVAQTNAVDRTLAGSAFTVEDFTTRVAQAFADNRGGVYDASLYDGSFEFGAGGVKTLQSATGPFNSYGFVFLTSNPRAISGSVAMASAQTFAPLELDLTHLSSGIGSNERVTDFGVTILANAYGPTAGTTNLTVRAYYGDGTTSALQYIISGDTFLGFQAPAGQSIERMKFTTNINGFYFDDFGFITATTAAPTVRFNTAPAAVWAEAVAMPGNTYSITQSPASTNIRLNRSGVTSRGIVEIPIDQIPSGATIKEVEFGFEPSISPAFQVETIALYGYAGDGVIDSADPFRTATLVGRITVQDTQERVVQIDPAFVQSLLSHATHLGLVAIMETDQGYVGWSNNVNGPVLQITYNVPEPAVCALLLPGTMFIFCRRLRRRR